MIDILKLLVPALIGLALWRYQLIGKRRYEIAEQLVTAATRAVQVLRFTRHIAAYASEGQTRSRNPDESEETARRLNDLYVPIERLAKNAEVFHDLFRCQVLCEMHFGDQHGRPFRVLLAAHDDIANAAWTRLRARDNLENEVSREVFRTIYGGDGDEIAPRINAAFDDIKGLADSQLRPHWLTLLLPFVKPEHIAWGRDRARYYYNRAMGRR